MCGKGSDVVSVCLQVYATGGFGMSDMYMLNNVGDSTPPCGTPVLSCCCFDCESWYVVYAFRPLM